VIAAPAASGQHPRLSPANTEGLLHDRYDLRAADGLRICTVTRDAAARQIEAGTVELIQGPSGAYLRPVASGLLPDGRTHHGGHRTWHGPVEPGQGAPARYDHALAVCEGYDPTLRPRS
jgi:hypothetical protein